MLEVVLHREKQDAGAAGQRDTDNIANEEQHRAHEPCHQRPDAQQCHVVPEHVPVLQARRPVGRLEREHVRLDRYAGLRDLAPYDVAHQLGAASQPGQARIQDQIDEAGKRRQPDAARAAIPALLGRGHRGIFVDRDDVQRPAIFRPVAIGGMVMQVVLRPHVLRHAGHHTEGETENLVEAAAAKQAAMTAFVHQHEHPDQEQAHHSDHTGGEPVRYVGAQEGGIPEHGERHERRGHRHEPRDVVRPDVAVDDRALECF